MELSPYEKLQLDKARKDGRRPAAPAPIREAKQKALYIGRRRAVAVLIANHKDEFTKIQKVENEALRALITSLYEDGMTTEELLAKFYEAVK